MRAGAQSGEQVSTDHAACGGRVTPRSTEHGQATEQAPSMVMSRRWGAGTRVSHMVGKGWAGWQRARRISLQGFG